MKGENKGRWYVLTIRIGPWGFFSPQGRGDEARMARQCRDEVRRVLTTLLRLPFNTRSRTFRVELEEVRAEGPVIATQPVEP